MGKHWWPWCCCPYCTKRFSKQMKVVVANLVDDACDDCEAFDGTYAPLEWIGKQKKNVPFYFVRADPFFASPCEGILARGVCEWRGELIYIREPTWGCGARWIQVALYIGYVEPYYYVEVWLTFSLGLFPVGGSTLKFTNRYTEKPDCENFDGLVMGSFRICRSLGSSGTQCDANDYTSVTLTALETCK